MVKKNQSHKVYVVEDILDTKINHGCQFYKVKWKGYSHAECTWEPEQSFNCSRDILNQFLEARALKQPSFKEKLRKIQKEKQLFLKNSIKSANKTKLIKKNQKFNKQEENQDSFNENEESNKYSSDSEEDGQIETEEKPAYGKSSESSLIKSQESRANPIPGKLSHSLKQSTNQKQAQDYSKEQKSNAVKLSTPTLTPSILPKKDTLEIIKIDKEGESLKFYVKQNDKKMWKTREEMHQKYLRQLCEYYEKYLAFD